MTPPQTDLKHIHLCIACAEKNTHIGTKEACALFTKSSQSTTISIAIDYLHTHTVWLHSNSVGDVREDTNGIFSVLKVDKSVSLEVKAVYV